MYNFFQIDRPSGLLTQIYLTIKVFIYIFTEKNIFIVLINEDIFFLVDLNICRWISFI